MNGPASFAALMLCGLLLAACDGSAARDAARTLPDSATADAIARGRQDSVNRAQPGYVVDSIFPPEVELRRFRSAFPGDSGTVLDGGSPSREALVRRFVKALSTNDISDLRAMAVHGREFSDLYYPESPYARPPYRQPVSFAWRMIQDPSGSGLSKLLTRLGGKPMTFVSEKCEPNPLHEGRTTRFSGCLVRVLGSNGDTATRRYFGSIIERGGQFKFLSYTNDF